MLSKPHYLGGMVCDNVGEINITGRLVERYHYPTKTCRLTSLLVTKKTTRRDSRHHISDIHPTTYKRVQIIKHMMMMILVDDTIVA
jgi:hypothetical protein